jgi:hypothetical protein
LSGIPALGAGGPEFKSRRPDHFMFCFFYHLEMIAFLLLPLEVCSYKPLNLYNFGIL